MKLQVNNTHPSVPQDSIWGPAPARDFRQSGGNQHSESDSQKAKGKKKKKMQKIDSSILGFTCAADPDRINVGEIEADGTTKWADYIQETGFNQPQKLCIIWWWQQFLYYVWELGGSYWWLSMRCVCTVLSDRSGPEVLQSAQDQLTLTTHYTSHHYKVCVLAYQTWQPVSVITLCFKGPADHLNLLNHDFLFSFLCCSLWSLFYVSVLFYLRDLPELWYNELSDSEYHIMIWNLTYSHDSCPQTKWTIQTCAI